MNIIAERTEKSF